MAGSGNITLPKDVFAEAERMARAEGTTADAFVTNALQKELARRYLAEIRKEAALNQGDMTEDEIEDYVVRLVHKVRDERTRGA